MSKYLLIVLLSHFAVGSSDAIAPDFPAEVLGTRDDDLSIPSNAKHKEGIYSKRVVSKQSFPKRKKSPPKDIAGNWISLLFRGLFFFLVIQTENIIQSLSYFWCYPNFSVSYFIGCI